MNAHSQDKPSGNSSFNMYTWRRYSCPAMHWAAWQQDGGICRVSEFLACLQTGILYGDPAMLSAPPMQQAENAAASSTRLIRAHLTIYYQAHVALSSWQWKGALMPHALIIPVIAHRGRCEQGVGGAHAMAITMRSSKMAYVEMGGATLHDVRCMLTEAAGGPDFSVHAHGTLCAGLLARCTTIFDFAHHRMACLQE